MNLQTTVTYSWLGCLLIFGLVSTCIRNEFTNIHSRRRLYFVVGLIFSRSISYTSLTSVLMWYFTYHDGDLVMSAVFSNIHESLSSLFVIFMAHASDSYIGRFRTLLFSTTAYIGGMMLLWMFNPYDVKWLLVIILVLLALGTSGDYILYDLTLDLVDDGNKAAKAERDSLPFIRSVLGEMVVKDPRKTADVVWRFIHIYASSATTMCVVQYSVAGTNGSWRSSFLICNISMAVALLLFCKGRHHYHQGPLKERASGIFFAVFRARVKNIVNSNPRYPTNVSTQKVYIKRKEKGEEDIRIIKSLIRMFPMWGLFIAVSLVSATGKTFFLEQYSNLNTAKYLPIQIYGMIQSVSGFAMRCVYRWICGKHKNEKVKIGVGMLCGIICCVIAWQLEVHRLDRVHDLIDQDQSTSINFLWLVPQFCVLGWMEELTGDGLLTFYELQIKDEPINNYGEEYIEVVQCFGKLFNIGLILIFKRVRWFGHTINDSRLDKYYILLVCFCSANLIIYFCTVMCFYNRHPPEVSDDNDDDLQRSP